MGAPPPPPPPPPPDGPHQQGPPPYGAWPPPPRPPREGSPGLVIGLAFAGAALYSLVNVVLGLLMFFAAMGRNGGTPWMAVGAVALALVGLGAGAGLLFVRRPWATGLGLGLMIGWALWSMVSAGYCTGLNPSLYG
ncbi:hypothetical protein MTP10_03460 [Nonomuraea sp. 3-1Str]|uniref:hypothetical protein n=1 Tax=Nonomuraea sp. 3-1Str TaxID=2929801 RepID=UPI00285A0095|nr:hypothetical protein [Nonomuraea sp. 3-1Str]MDR8407793.1 hypothetical protein [Nonomuraea sp. 3-1Str]